MQKYFITNRTVTGIVTINQEALDFGKKGFAIAEKEETFEAAKLLYSLGYKPLTEEEFKSKEPELYAIYEQSLETAEYKISEAKKFLEESEKELKENEPKLKVDSVADIVAHQNTLKEVIEGGDITDICSAVDGLKHSWEVAKAKPVESPATSFEEAQGETIQSAEGKVENPSEGEQVSGEVENEEGKKEDLEPASSEENKENQNKEEQQENSSQEELTPKERSAKLRSAKQRLNSAKKRWDAVPEEETEQRAAIEKEISEIEEEIKSLQ